MLWPPILRGVEGGESVLAVVPAFDSNRKPVRTSEGTEFIVDRGDGIVAGRAVVVVGKISRNIAILLDSRAKSKGVSPNRFRARESALCSISNWAILLFPLHH